VKNTFFFSVGSIILGYFKKTYRNMQREIRAYYTSDSIRVYQAFNNTIAESAIKHQRFISPPFKIQRATWIKPSFLWMMYRCGWAAKENQERVLAVDITHEGFQWALNNSCLSHYDQDVYDTVEVWERIKAKSPVVVQWDPERDIFLNQLSHRSIQVGLLPEASALYSTQWVVKISDMTETARKIKQLVDVKKMEEAYELLPVEKKYPITTDICRTIGIPV
jgi:hypothetical protein